MKKNKLFFLLVACTLSLGSLTACNLGGDVPSVSPSTANTSAGGESSALPGDSSQGPSNPSSNITPQPSSVSPSQPGSSNVAPSSTPVQPSSNPVIGSSSVAPSSNPAGSSTSQAPVAGWSSRDLEAFNDCIYGVVIPYPGEGSIVYPGWGTKPIVTVTGSEFGRGDLANYAAKFVAEDWTGGDCSASLNISAGYAYEYTKTVQTTDGIRFVSAMFGCVTWEGDDMVYGPEGTLYLVASDPFDYNYSDMIDELLSSIDTFGLSNDLPPELAGVTRYVVSPGDETDPSVVVTMFIDSTTALRDFNTLLTNNNWAVVAGENGNMIAYSPNDMLKVTYYYDSVNKCLILHIEEYSTWNPLRIEQFFAKYQQQVVEFPPLIIEGAKYTFKENENNALYVQSDYLVYVNASMTVKHNSITSANFSAYLKVCQDKDFVVADFGDGTAYISKMIGEDNYYQAMVEFDSNGKSIVITIYATGRSGMNRLYRYPSDQINAFLGDTQDTLPVFEARNAGYRFSSNKDKAGLVVFSDLDGAAAAISSYETKLKRNGYKADGNGFLSANGEIKVELSHVAEGIDECILISIQKIDTTPHPTAWPSEDIATAIANNLYSQNPITDIIPQLDVSNATTCYVNSNMSSQFEIVIEGLVSSLETFKAVFKRASWVEDEFYYYGTNMTGVMVSPNKQLMAHFEPNDNDVVIYVSSYRDPYYDEWPASRIATTIAGWGATNDSVPSFDSASSIINIDVTDGSKTLKYYLMLRDDSLVNRAVAVYQESLARLGYSYSSSLNGYVTRNGELLISLNSDGYYGMAGVNIIISYIGPEPEPEAEWPADEISGWGNGLSLTDEIPEMPSTNVASFEYKYDPDQLKHFAIQVNGKDGVTGQALKNEYKAILLAEDSDFAQHGEGADEVFYTDNHEIEVYLFVNPTYMTISVWVYEEPETAEWPTDDINFWLEYCDLQDEVVPSFENATSIEIDYDDDDNMIIKVYCDDPSSASESYFAALVSDWGYSEPDPNDVELYLSPSGNLGIDTDLAVDYFSIILMNLVEPDPHAQYKIDAKSWNMLFEGPVFFSEDSNYTVCISNYCGGDESYTYFYFVNGDFTEHEYYYPEDNEPSEAYLKYTLVSFDIGIASYRYYGVNVETGVSIGSGQTNISNAFYMLAMIRLLVCDYGNLTFNEVEEAYYAQTVIINYDGEDLIFTDVYYYFMNGQLIGLCYDANDGEQRYEIEFYDYGTTELEEDPTLGED